MPRLATILNAALAPALAFAWAVPAMTATSLTVTTTWGAEPVHQAASWSPRMAELFPGCQRELPDGVVPAAVVWVQDGWPRKVEFADAWRRTHDADRDNHGEVVAQCR